MRLYGKSGVARLMAGVAAGAIVMGASAAWAQSKPITVEPQPLMSALHDFGSQTGVQILYAPEILKSKVSSGVAGAQDEQSALTTILAGTGLTFRREANAYVIVQQGEGGGPQGASGVGGVAEVEALIVTAQKKNESIQDVPIAISAFSMKQLDAQKIEGGFDLLKAVPNVTFSKTNFSGYNFQIRGVGTQAVSATTDPGVAVSFNNTTLIVNRLFEQEYVDIERVEVLRGPQGTLYGRNATGGVINVISAKPVLGDFFGELKLEAGNFNAQRVRGHVNVPLGDTLALRGAFAMTKRDGYGYNEASEGNDTREFGDVVRSDVDGRDLWTGRLTLGWEPTENIRFNLMWERFREDDNRVRTSKQLCTRDTGPGFGPIAGSRPIEELIGQRVLTEDGVVDVSTYANAPLSQACKAGSLYADEAYGTPNGASLPYVQAHFTAFTTGTEFAHVINLGGAAGLGGDPWFWDPNVDRPCIANAREAFSAGVMLAVDVCNPDVYGGRTQSRNLRSIYSALEPTYRADSDVFELSMDWDLGSAVFSSQTVYAVDDYYASQDYNRFTSDPIWRDSSTACGIVEFVGQRVDCTQLGEELIVELFPGFSLATGMFDTGVGAFAPLTDLNHDGIIDQTRLPLNGPDPVRHQSGNYTVDDEGFVRDELGARVGFYRDMAPGGVFCDPQLGCSNSLVVQDLSQSKSSQFNQEFRLVSNYDGAFNYSIGANYTRFETTNDYYVFANALTYLVASTWPFDFHGSACAREGLLCRYVDPNPLEEINGEGHNYFRSSNPYKLTSAAIFGESYWNITDTLKLTAGLRFTWDRKVFTPIPSQLLLNDYRELLLADPANLIISLGLPGPGDGVGACENVAHCPLAGTAPGGRGIVADPDIVQEWREPTGRLVLDWQPDLAFTDETMLYASVARGYKGGGANPPSVSAPARFWFDRNSGGFADTFKAEYVNAVEVGAKNTILGGSATLNLGAFHYDYTDYQVSRIVDRRAVNDNFDATIWGLEMEATFAPTRDLRFNMTVGYLNTRIADGETAIDIMDRTDGGNRFFANPDGDFPEGFSEWVVVQPFITAPANCVVPRELAHANFLTQTGVGGASRGWAEFCPNGNAGGVVGVQNAPYFDEAGNLVPSANSDRHYRPRLDAPNGGAGFAKDLGGNALPNAPEWTFSLGGQYTMYLPGGWDMTARTDFYWQADSFARVYNLRGYDELRSWTNTNLSIWITNADWGFKAEAYVKNVFDETPITGTFLNSEDSGLTTNVFTLDPRLVGVSVTKEF